jgi:hypothetical protein
MKKKRNVVPSPSAGSIHAAFGLTYANYLVLPRAVLQSMPLEWQDKFVKLLREANAACQRAGIPTAHAYRVQMVAANGRYVADEVPHYRYAPNLFVEHALPVCAESFRGALSDEDRCGRRQMRSGK